jgi:type II secretion system protein G
MGISKKGFTLVELLIVIVVIAILAGISIVAYNGVQNRARDTAIDASVSTLKKGLELYKLYNGQYPSLGTHGTGYAAGGLSAHLVPTYMEKMPDMTGIYQYVTSADGYGLYINYFGRTDCKTGVNINQGWWGSGFPVCP